MKQETLCGKVSHKRFYVHSSLRATMSKIQRILLFLALVVVGNNEAWGDTTLFSTDFSNDIWKNITFSQGNTSTADVHNGITFFCKASDKSFSINNALIFPGQNLSTSNYYIAIPIENINGSVTITVKGEAKSTFRYTVDSNTATAPSAANQTTTKQDDNNGISSITVQTDKTSAMVFIGEQSSSYTKIYSITITTSDKSTPSSGPTATFTYGYTVFPQEATMSITVPAHKAGNQLSVTLSDITDGATATCTSAGSLNGNTLTFNAPSAGSEGNTIVQVTKDGVSTTYTINVKTETKVGVTFNESTRYSQVMIDARKDDFRSNANTGGLSYGTNLDYVPGLVAKAMIETVDYYKDHQTATINNDKLATWYNAVKTYGTKSIATKGTSGQSFDDLNATKIYFGLKKVAASGKITGIESDVDSWNTKLTSALEGIKNANTSYSISSSHATYPISVEGMQGGWWHKADYINQMWGDGQYMGTALLAQLINDKDIYDATNAEKRVSEDDWALVTKQFTIAGNYLWDYSKNLPHHAFAADKGTNSTSHSDTWKFDGDTYRNEGIWGRATGWFFMALVDALEQMPTSNTNYSTIKGYFTNMAAGIKQYQDNTTGCWYQLPIYDHTFSAADYNSSQALSGRRYNYLESSATALFTAGLLKGLRLGLLDKATYEETAKKAYRGMIENFMDANNNIYWSCRSAGIGGSGDDYKAGGKKFRDGSNAYYLKGYDVAPVYPSENLTEGKVLGAFIMAATEYERAYVDNCTKTHTDPTIGATKQFAEYHQAMTTPVAINKGETKTFTFQNHGNPEQNYYNWILAAVTSGSTPSTSNWGTEQVMLRADHWAWGAVMPQVDNTPTITSTSFDWTNFSTDMQNADVQVEVSYSAEGVLSIVSNATANGRTYNQQVTSNTVTSSDQMYLYFTIDHSHITNFQEVQAGSATINITTQPVSANFEQWVTASPLTVAASASNGSELSYQWYTCNSDGTNEKVITNATSASYTPGTTGCNTYYLKCKISADGCTPVYTNVVTMTVTNTVNYDTSNLTEITETYTFTPSTKLKAHALTSDGKILAVDNGNEFNNLGMSFKSNRQLAFKVAAGAIITIQLYNNGSAARTGVLSTSSGYSSDVVAQQEVPNTNERTATLTYTSAEGGLYYLTSADDLYVKSINVTWPVTGVTVSPETVYVSLSGTADLTATVAPSNASNKNVTWSSADNAIATIDATGKVTGKATYGGVTKVYATTEDGEKKDSTIVNVYRFSPGGITTTYQTGTSGAVTYIPVAFYDGSDASGNAQSVSLSLSDFSIVSSNTSVISIPQLYFDSSKSRLSFTPTIGNAGTATVTITYNGSNANYNGKTCTIDYTVSDAKYKVSYEMKGHGAQENPATDVTELPNPLPTPTGDGYTFVGWYTEDALTNAAVAGTAISADQTLYAKWTIDKGYISPLYPNGDGKTITLDHIQEPQRGMGVMLPAAYETVENIDVPSNGNNDTDRDKWTFAENVSNKGTYGNGFREAYFGSSVGEGNVLTQTVSGLTNGKYEVVLDVAASATNIRDFKTAETALPTGNNLTQAFAGTATKFIPVLDRTVVGTYTSTEYDRIALVTEVTDGTLTYGLKNTAASGNWYLCRVQSIKKITNEHFLGWYNDAENGTRVGGEGDTHVPNYNGTGLYAHWKKEYTFRPVASNGNLVSVYVNDVQASVVNNNDITVYEGDKIVMTATPSTGYKFKNWVLSSGGTPGVESVDGTNNIYTISAIGASTTLSAKFEAKSTATDPNPENGILSGTIVTINSFPAAYAGQTQRIDLGLPSGASFTISSGSGSIVDGKLSVVAPNANNSSSVTILVSAEAGNTATYTINYSTANGASFSYTVNAVDGSNNVLQVIKSGVYAEGTGGVTLNYPEYVKVGSEIRHIKKEYSTTGIESKGWYQISFTPDAADYTVNLPYTEGTIKDIITYAEGEDALAMRNNSYTRASNGGMGRNTAEQVVATLPTGTYYIKTKAINGNSDTKTYTVKAGDVTIITGSVNYGNNAQTSEATFSVTGDTDIKIDAKSFGNGGGIDWFYIQDWKTLPVTADGQKLGLTTSIVDNTSYTTVSAAGKTGTFTRDEYTGSFYILKDSKTQYLTVTEQGATSFEVFAFHNNNSATRTLKVYIDDIEVGEVSVVPGTLCSSGIIPIASASSAKTITLKGTGSDVYPAYIEFYNTPKAPSITPSSTELGLRQTKTVTPTVPENCSITSMEAQTSTDIATATYTDGKLTVIGNKVGKTTVTFNVTGDGSAYASGTATFTITVTPLDLTLAYSPKEYVYKEEEAEGAQPTLPNITLTATDENGATVNLATAGISMAYTSDDVSVATVSNDGVITLQSGAIGSAVITAMAAKSTDYSAATATFYISITRGKSWKMTDGEYKSTAPKIRQGFEVKDGDNVLVKATFGGWNRGTDADHTNNTYTYSQASSGSSKTYQDSWSAIVEQKPDIDGYTKYRFGAQDAMNEDMYVSGTRDGSSEIIYGVKRNGWFISPIQNGVMTDTKHPFTLPVRGAYMTFEPTCNGTLTIYINQNGAWNSSKKDIVDNDGNDVCNGVEFPGRAPFQFRPHCFYIVDQEGMPLQKYTKFNVVTKTKVTTGLDEGTNSSLKEEQKTLLNNFCEKYGAKKGEKYKCIIDPTADGYNDVTNIGNWNEFKNYMSEAEQKRVYEAWSSGVDGAQQIIEMDNGSFLAIDEGMVKYTFYVASNQTYYIFSNFSKLGFAGCNFVPDVTDNQPTATLSLSDITPYVNPTLDAVKSTTTNSTNHVGNITIPQYKTITLTRSFTAGNWETICLPFTMTEKEVRENFGEGTELIIMNGTNTSGTVVNINFIYHEIQSILAGYPYLIKPTKTISEITVNNKLIDPDLEMTTFRNGDYTFTGIPGYSTANVTNANGVEGYSVLTNAGDIFLSGNKLYISKGSSYIKGYRSYIKLNEESTGQAKSVTLSFGNSWEDEESDTPTILEGSEADEALTALGMKHPDGVYNLQGQKVGDSIISVPAGIYIVNGKKIVIKKHDK